MAQTENAGPELLSIGELAQRANLRPSAIRYYERVGLLPSPPRKNGQRRYDGNAVRLLTTLRFAQRAGFTVAEIKTLFHGFGSDVPPATRWQVLAKRKLTDLDALIADAERMRKVLQVGMRCGCLRVEDCISETDEGCCLPGPPHVALARAKPASRAERLAVTDGGR
jgi:MerR family transcriptional regulator, redox-sensitive transcriptional activator SoxR